MGKPDQDVGIEVFESFEDGHRILTIVDVSMPKPPPIPNDRLFGIGERLRRLYGGEWVGDFESSEIRKILIDDH